MSNLRLIATVCAAQTLSQIGAFAVPALLPVFISQWALTNTQAGWITGIFYLAYITAVPVLVSLTDRIDPKRVYLFGVTLTTLAAAGYALFAEGFWSALLFRAIWGVGWAGTYMPGLKALSDQIEGPGQSRAVAAHAASLGLSGAASFVIAGTVADAYGWQWGVGIAGIGAALAFLIMLILFPSRAPLPPADPGKALLDFRPVLRNRSALAYSIGYCVHTLELGALRNWAVTFLTFTAAYHGAGSSVATWLTPVAVATALGVMGVVSSVTGNEVSIRFGRRRLILLAMCAGILTAAGIGFSSAVTYGLAAALVVFYAVVIWADSSSLTAGASGSALPGQRGATLAVHSTLGYGGGFLGPLVIGIILDAAGGESVTAWGLAFAGIAAIGLLGPLAMLVLKPQGLAGDK